jgi:hypothetical protein
VNDEPAIEAGALSPSPHHVRGTLGVAIGSMLTPGENRLRVDVRTDRHDGGLVNPLYLAGSFAVDFAGGMPRLAPPRTTGTFEAWDHNGLPHYAGILACHGTFQLQPGAGDPLAAGPSDAPCLLRLHWPAPFQDAAEVSINGGPWHPVLWAPALVPVDRSQLRSGANQIGIRIHTAMLRAFEGQRFDLLAHQAVDLEG